MYSTRQDREIRKHIKDLLKAHIASGERGLYSTREGHERHKREIKELVAKRFIKDVPDVKLLRQLELQKLLVDKGELGELSKLMAEGLINLADYNKIRKLILARRRGAGMIGGKKKKKKKAKKKKKKKPKKKKKKRKRQTKYHKYVMKLRKLKRFAHLTNQELLDLSSVFYPSRIPVGIKGMPVIAGVAPMSRGLVPVGRRGREVGRMGDVIREQENIIQDLGRRVGIPGDVRELGEEEFADLLAEQRRRQRDWEEGDDDDEFAIVEEEEGEEEEEEEGEEEELEDPRIFIGEPGPRELTLEEMRREVEGEEEEPVEIDWSLAEAEWLDEFIEEAPNVPEETIERNLKKYLDRGLPIEDFDPYVSTGIEPETESETTTEEELGEKERREEEREEEERIREEQIERERGQIEYQRTLRQLRENIATGRMSEEEIASWHRQIAQIPDPIQRERVRREMGLPRVREVRTIEDIEKEERELKRFEQLRKEFLEPPPSVEKLEEEKLEISEGERTMAEMIRESRRIAEEQLRIKEEEEEEMFETEEEMRIRGLEERESVLAEGIFEERMRQAEEMEQLGLVPMQSMQSIEEQRRADLLERSREEELSDVERSIRRMSEEVSPSEEDIAEMERRLKKMMLEVEKGTEGDGILFGDGIMIGGRKKKRGYGFIKSLKAPSAAMKQSKVYHYTMGLRLNPRFDHLTDRQVINMAKQWYPRAVPVGRGPGGAGFNIGTLTRSGAALHPIKRPFSRHAKDQLLKHMLKYGNTHIYGGHAIKRPFSRHAKDQLLKHMLKYGNTHIYGNKKHGGNVFGKMYKTISKVSRASDPLLKYLPRGGLIKPIGLDERSRINFMSQHSGVLNPRQIHRVLKKHRRDRGGNLEDDDGRAVAQTVMEINLLNANAGVIGRNLTADEEAGFIQDLRDRGLTGGKKGKRKKKKKKKKKRAPSAWNIHFGKMRKQFPNLSFKQCIVKAKKSYKKKKKGGLVKGFTPLIRAHVPAGRFDWGEGHKLGGKQSSYPYGEKIYPESKGSKYKHVFSSHKRVKKNPWMQHIQMVRNRHPNLTYKQAMIKAKESY